MLHLIQKFQSTLFFAIVGTIGFCVDTTILYLTKEYIGLFYARGVSFTCSVFTTWLLNRTITFRKRPSALNLKAEFVSYYYLMLFGGLVNYSAYSFMILVFDYVYSHPILGVAIGSIAGMLVNLILAKRFLYKKKTY
jgi:putative flippase GtrA